MDRREFGKLLAVAIAVPSLIKLNEVALPAKMSYRGFDCLVNDMPRYGPGVKQVYWANGTHSSRLLVDCDADWEKVEGAIKDSVDRYYKRRVA